jgi:hypothetical protein
MSVAADIAQSWVAPARVVRRLLVQGQREDRALAFLMLGCALVFVSEWPALLAAPGDVPVEARLGGALMAWLGLMPLALYGVAALSHLAARTLGGQGSFWGARLALFWALFAAAPLWLLAAALATLVPPPAAAALDAAALAGFLWLWLGGLVAAERRGVDAVG